jgi:hypothetical protein
VTISKGVGRGGVRPGAGRKPKAINWEAIAQAYFTGQETPEDVCQKFNVTLGDLFIHAQSEGWIHRPYKPHPADVGRLGSALAHAMISVDGAGTRSSRFVAAMAKLGSPLIDIAAALEISVGALRSEFRKELGL